MFELHAVYEYVALGEPRCERRIDTRWRNRMISKEYVSEGTEPAGALGHLPSTNKQTERDRQTRQTDGQTDGQIGHERIEYEHMKANKEKQGDADEEAKKRKLRCVYMVMSSTRTGKSPSMLPRDGRTVHVRG